MLTASTSPAVDVLPRVRRRLIPFIFLCYVVAYLDRLNLGFAASAMQADLHLGDQVYGTGAGLFFLGYFLFEVPSNLILERVGARRWLARIMIAWGIVSMLMVLVSGKWSFYGMRVLLGLAESGFFPGVILYLTYWIPARERARTGALFMTAAPVAILAGAPLSSLLLGMNGWLGLRGWQWLFLAEGLPAVALGLIALVYLTDRPEVALWLPQGDRDWLVAEMARDRAATGVRHLDLAASLRSRRVWILCVVYFLNTSVTYGIFLWLPKILEDASSARGLALAALTAGPFVFALIAMVYVGARSDRTGRPKQHAAGCALVAALGLVLAAASGQDLPLLLASITICQAAQRSVQAPFWALPPLFLGGTAAAAGFAMINAIGNLGGYAGPTMMGYLRQATGGYGPGMLVLAAALLVEAGVVIAITLPSPVPRAVAVGQ